MGGLDTDTFVPFNPKKNNALSHDLIGLNQVLAQKDKSSELQASLIASGTGLLMIL